MLKSMTGFGRCVISEGTRKIAVEMKSVNHRYLDIAIRMPKRLNMFESAIRNVLKQSIQRGKVDIYITLEDLSESNYTLKYNSNIANQYMNYFQEMAERFSLENDMTVSKLSRFSEVFTMEEESTDDEELFEHIEKAITGAVRSFSDTRANEGENLKKDLIKKLDHMTQYVIDIERRLPEVLTDYQNRLEEKVNELLKNTVIDQNRILAEVMIFADKICVDEEMVRLRSHIKATIQTLEQGEGIGRKLDFIVQEMNREANTILSKSNDLFVSEQGINLKTEIEKIREQIQNIE